MLTLIVIIVLFVFRLWQQINNQNLELLINQTFSFAKLLDSKFIGLILFMVSNLMTGIINLNIKTIYTSDFISMIIILCYIFCSFFISYFFYNIFNLKEKKKTDKLKI